MMRAIDELRAPTAGQLLRIRRAVCAGGWDAEETGLRCNAQVLAESCFWKGEAVFPDGEAVLDGLSVAEMDRLLDRIFDGKPPQGRQKGGINPHFDEARFRVLQGVGM